MKTDRMGGFIAVRIIRVKDISIFTKSGEQAKITPKPGKEFFEIPVKKYGISPNVTDSKDKSGVIYSININISVKNRVDITFVPFNKYLVICTNPLGEDILFGTPEYPLSGSRVPVLSDRASGVAGLSIKFTGKQPYPPLELVS